MIWCLSYLYLMFRCESPSAAADDTACTHGRFTVPSHFGAFGVLGCYVRHAEAHFSPGGQPAFSSYGNLKKKKKWTGILRFCVYLNDGFLPLWNKYFREQNIHPVAVTANTNISAQQGNILWLHAGQSEVMLWLMASRRGLLFLHVIKNKN